MSSSETPPSHASDVGPAPSPEAGHSTAAGQPAASLTAAAAVAAASAAVLAWSYWPTLKAMVSAWEREPDYSHGFLVPPLAAIMLWTRRKDFPGLAGRSLILGGLCLAAWLALRFAGGLLYIDAVDGWSFLAWCVAVALLIGGLPLLKWCWPAIAFLFFMIPLPYKAERMLSLPLQKMATTASCWVLQLLGQPALQEGNTIILGEHNLEVEEACSGLRIFVGVVALAFAYAVLMRKKWWETLTILAAAAPVAVVANVARIVVTGLLYLLAEAEAAQKFSHDVAGWAMIPFALVLLAGFVWYLDRLVPKVPVVDVRQAMRRKQMAT